LYQSQVFSQLTEATLWTDDVAESGHRLRSTPPALVIKIRIIGGSAQRTEREEDHCGYKSTKTYDSAHDHPENTNLGSR